MSIIQQCQSRPEGMTARQWMTDNGISPQSYYYWLRKFRKESYGLAVLEDYAGIRRVVLACGTDNLRKGI